MTFPSERQLKAMEAVINQAIKLDPLACQRLEQLAGKRFRIECTEPAADVLIEINKDSILLKQPDEQTVTSHLAGDFSAFAKLMSADDKAAALINADLRLQGDSQLLIELEDILSHIELDWEYQLAQHIGDLPAHLIGKAGRTGFNWLKNSQPIFMRHLQEYILEEARLSPTKAELENFIHSILSLDQQVERIEAKLSRLKSKVESSQNKPGSELQPTPSDNTQE